MHRFSRRNIQKIEMVQRRAARFVTHRYRQTSSVTDMLQDLNWRSLQNRRIDNSLVMFYKIVYGQVAVDPLSFLVPTINTRASRFRNSMSFQIPHSKLDIHLYSFFPSTIRLWNGLNDNLISAPSADAFHSHISNIDHVALK